MPKRVGLIAVTCMAEGWKEDAYKRALTQVEACARGLGRRLRFYPQRRASGQRICNEAVGATARTHRRAFHDQHRRGNLAATLTDIANGGRESFYGGDSAKSIVRKSERCGGFFSLPDLAEHQSKWEEPLCATYRGNEVTVPPPNSYGLLVLLQLKILANHDLTKHRHNTAEYLWLQLEGRISENVSRRLVKEGYKVRVCGPWKFAFGGAEAIWLHKKGKVFMAAADPRRDGYVIVLSRCGIRVSTCALGILF